MLRKATLLFFSVFIFWDLLIAQEWWEKIPCAEWSDEQLIIFLEFSPWVRHSSTFLVRKTMESRAANYPEYYGIDYPEYYVVRLLTARPVREAMLQIVSQMPGMVVSLDEFNKSDVEVREERLRKFIASNPTSVVVKGDEEHIIISMMLISRARPPFLQEDHIIAQVAGPLGSMIMYRNPFQILLLQYQHSTQPSKLTLSKLIAGTSLETDTGKRMRISGYIPSDAKGLGAQFIFKRRMPDSTSFITADDKELRFKTRVDDRKIRIKFDLKKMIYKGKLEY